MKIKNSICQQKYVRYKISIEIKNPLLENSLQIFPFLVIWKKIDFLKSFKLLESYKNVHRKLSAKRECHTENVFFKADRALSKLNFLFHLKWKTNLVTLRKSNSHLQYYILEHPLDIRLGYLLTLVFARKYKWT